MPTVDLPEQDWQQILSILGTTKEFAWVVTNPLLMKIGQQLQPQQPSSPPWRQPIRTDGKEQAHE